MSRHLPPLIVILFLLIAFSACLPKTGSTAGQVCFDKVCFDVEIAQTSKERRTGLQHRSELGENKGMLFIFPESKRHAFWMKNTLITLDMIWMDADKRIVSMTANVLPCTTQQCPSYTPKENALYVLEVNAGIIKEHGLKVGDQATFR